MKINEIIKQRYPFEPTKKLADDLNLTLSQVYNRAFLMGIKKDPVYLRSTQFPAGYLGGKATQFQRGHVPANKGYKMSKYKLILYGVSSPEGLKIYKLDDIVYLKSTSFVYRLDATGEFKPYERITDESILNRLK